MSKISNKLEVLRRNNDLSQKQVAEQFNIDVFEYMSYENGKLDLDEKLIIEISEFYGVKKEILTDDHFHIAENIKVKSEEIDNELPSFVKIDELRKFSETSTIKVTKKDQLQYKFTNLSIMKKLILLVNIIVIITLVILLSFNRDKPEQVIVLNLSRNKQDLIEASTYGIVYYQGNNLNSRGLDLNGQLAVSSLHNVVKVQMNDDTTVLLNKDGTLTLLGSYLDEYDISKWNAVKDISLGKNHLVAINSDDKLLCESSSSVKIGCDFKEHVYNEKIAKIYTFDHNTMVVSESGNVYTNEYLKLKMKKEMKPIKDIVGLGNEVWVLYDDGTISNIKGDKFLDFKEENIDKLVLLNDGIFAKTKEGKIIFSSKNEDYLKLLEIDNVIDITGYNNYIVALTDDDIVGVGNNENNIFNEINTKEITLDKVSNILTNITNEGLHLSFNHSNNANSYLIEINNESNFKLVTKKNEILIPLNNFVENVGYTIKITALIDQVGYQNSLENSYHFVYYPPKLNDENNNSTIIPTNQDSQDVD